MNSCRNKEVRKGAGNTAYGRNDNVFRFVEELMQISGEISRSTGFGKFDKNLSFII